ncbi:hypothetical protein V4D09_06895, partial [Vibrio mimicus]|uniref:hypothetical protein n=1 Tax=Vibrio mimicus TaxID=674 RepID=UPI002F95AC10
MKSTLGVPSSSSDAVKLATFVPTTASFSLNAAAAVTSIVGPSFSAAYVGVSLSVAVAFALSVAV